MSIAELNGTCDWSLVRRYLFASEEVHHGPGVEDAESDRKQFRGKHGVDGGLRRESGCTSVFLAEPPEWLEVGAAQDTSGRLDCPSCSTKLGGFSWFGVQCSCT